jgi:hypothetical protein
MVVDNELGWMWKEMIVAQFNAPLHLPGGSEEIKILTQDIRYPSRDWNGHLPNTSQSIIA